ncbi:MULTISPECIES: bifunctional diaminohydroxyphosphoribosylaminopyrimidine deaminase/5-amino-6-(5-phosphoribosylamino)uracil reductase RibD [Sorangium]|uniref:diaminohydroxyphosphoribosylaminopyrimidine deaminase n=1 Tax=Sorangium cellulosum TaxID=56 RepID=A0A4P2QEW7_SORCE|nr:MULTISPECIES: bifunctional diaminohydroxyphosphoribosylaminopyrimidine deaminase/5-amino-6-(5-phosphoribosylamino)uracil reductase RibD [Sorangium]AUX28377.1 DeoR family transcriptional regulator [Sorangium cellulosum]WCQ87769.1 Riboflavin biosynthesis protein RibD [Sorangium sp. Soce836]
MNDVDLRWMDRCLELAGRAAGRTAPNPMVGSVIVRGGEVLAEGFHERAGLAHAEVDALRKLAGRADGATLYVNLEPCCHHGRTPPCTDALLRSGVRRVVIGMIDPNPLVSGKGAALLESAGIEVTIGVREPACRELNRAYIASMAERTAVAARATPTS